jgi:hypothetical protein
LLGALERLGDVEAAEHAIAQQDGVRERLQPARVLREPGDGQRARDRAERDDELVIRELDRLAVDPAHGARPRARVRAADVADDELRALECGAQRDYDVARVERRACCAGEQRRVEHVVRVVDERHARAPAREDAFERARGVEAAEAASRDHHLPRHADRIRCV